MILSIIAMDSSWKAVYELAKTINIWDEIEVIKHPSYEELDYYVKEYSCLRTADLHERQLLIAAMTPAFREQEYIKWKSRNGHFATLVHPHNYIYPATQIGEGTIIFAGAIIYADSRIKENVVLTEYSSVSHDSYVGSHSVLMEKVTMGGHGIIESRVLIKANSVLRENVKIESDSIVDYGSVVFKDVEKGSVVCGNPARVSRKERQANDN